MKWIIIGSLVGLPFFLVILFTLIPTFATSEEFPLTEIITRAKNHEFSEIVVYGEKLTIIPRTDGAGSVQLTSRIGADTDLLNVLVNNGVDIGSGGLKVTFKGSGGLGSFLRPILNFLPLILILLIFVFMIKRLGKLTTAITEVAEALASKPST